MNPTRRLIVTAAAALAFGAAHADLTIGISLPLTGPASGLGIPIKNGLALWPGEIALHGPAPELIGNARVVDAYLGAGRNRGAPNGV